MTGDTRPTPYPRCIMATKTRISTFGTFRFVRAEFACPVSERSAPMSPVVVYGSQVARDYADAAGDTLSSSTYHRGQHTADAIGFDEDLPRFFLVYAEDCHSPMMAVVRADDEADALNIAIEECQWLQLSADDVAEREADGYGDTVGWNDGGDAYDLETLRMRQLDLVSVRFA